MGRKKIEIRPLRDDRNRSVTFLKRKAGLFKKAYELGVLCSADVAVIVFGHNGKLFEFSSNNIDQTLLRYTEYQGEPERKGPKDFQQKAEGDADDSDDDAAGPSGTNTDAGGADGGGHESSATPAPPKGKGKAALAAAAAKAKAKSVESAQVHGYAPPPPPTHFDPSNPYAHAHAPLLPSYLNLAGIPPHLTQAAHAHAHAVPPGAAPQPSYAQLAYRSLHPEELYAAQPSAPGGEDRRPHPPPHPALHPFAYAQAQHPLLSPHAPPSGPSSHSQSPYGGPPTVPPPAPPSAAQSDPWGILTGAYPSYASQILGLDPFGLAAAGAGGGAQAQDALGGLGGGGNAFQWPVMRPPPSQLQVTQPQLGQAQHPSQPPPPPQQQPQASPHIDPSLHSASSFSPTHQPHTNGLHPGGGVVKRPLEEDEEEGAPGAEEGEGGEEDRLDHKRVRAGE